MAMVNCLSKILASQIKSHIQNSGIFKNRQSANKCRNSTETALLYIQNDIFSAQDCGELTALSLLNLSAAFDTIDHDHLLSRLTLALMVWCCSGFYPT